MACLDMYNSDQHNKGHHCPPMSPRISFSNDFVDSQQMMKQERSPLSSSSSSSSHPPASSDFEFSVTGYSMMSADELFFKGRLLPFKDNSGGSRQMQRTTIRDQLLVDEDGDVEVSHRPPKGSTRWKGLLGLRRSHIGSKKVERVNSNSDHHQVTVGEVSRGSGSASFVRDQDHHQLVHVSNRSSEDVLSEGGSGCRDLEIGI